MAVSLPARAQRVTVLGFTRNSCATSDGVSSRSGASRSSWAIALLQCRAALCAADVHLVGWDESPLSDSSLNIRVRHLQANSPCEPSCPSQRTSHLAVGTVGAVDGASRSEGPLEPEDVVWCRDDATGLRAVIAVHST